MTTTRAPRQLILPASLTFACWNLFAAGAGRAQEAPPPAPPEHNNVRRAMEWKRFEYTCEGDAKVTVYVRDSTAKVLYKDHAYLMRQAVSADGARYSDGKVTWWGKGEEGFLQEESAYGDGIKFVKDCILSKAANPAAVSTLTGTLTYLVRMALPPQAVIQVHLQDVSRADAPATMVAQEKFELGNRQVPVSFTLKFDPAKIDPKGTYAVSARIVVAGEVRFATTESHRVLTQGNPSKIDLILKPAMGGKP